MQGKGSCITQAAFINLTFGNESTVTLLIGRPATGLAPLSQWTAQPVQRMT